MQPSPDAAASSASVPFSAASAPRLRVLGVPVVDITMSETCALLEGLITAQPQRSHSIYFVNAHTLNVASEDPSFREVLRNADLVFGDGTGVRWAARMLHGARLKDNVNGTDLVPRFFQVTAGRGYRYFFLGNTPERIERAAAYAKAHFTGWTEAGHHHGYLEPSDDDRIVAMINDSNAQMLLVGMGNPKQEQWIARNLAKLRVPLCLGTGGLFDYWSGDLDRAPAWVRRAGSEWVHLLIRQPHKAQRYLIGNPLFLMRVARDRVLGESSGNGA